MQIGQEINNFGWLGGWLVINLKQAGAELCLAQEKLR
jgi:hypothetical protein